jgi:hypothetical protein
MTEEMLVFLESPHLTEVVERAKEMLASILGDVPFRLQGVVDVGSSHGPRIKRLLKITSESEWFACKAVVLSLEVRSLDVLVVKDESPLYGVGIGREVEEVVLTQPTYGGGDGWEGVFDMTMIMVVVVCMQTTIRKKVGTVMTTRSVMTTIQVGTMQLMMTLLMMMTLVAKKVLAMQEL